LLEILIKL